MARPVSTHVPTVGGCPVFGRFGQAVSGTAQADTASPSDAEYAIPSFRGPTCSARTRYSSTVGEEVAFGVALDGPTPYEGILALQRGEDVNA